VMLVGHLPPCSRSKNDIRAEFHGIPFALESDSRRFASILPVESQDENRHSRPGKYNPQDVDFEPKRHECRYRRGIDAPVSFPRDRRCLPRYLRGPACRCDHSSTPL
jgi:hypothetical protein